MEESRFDTLLRKAALHASRRETLGALLGGALLLKDLGESDATKMAERRKQRRRRQRRRQGDSGNLRVSPVDILVDNTQGRKAILVYHGGSNKRAGGCCRLTENVGGNYNFTVRAGQSLMFLNQHSDQTVSFVVIENKYWFQFTNELILEPYAQIAVHGRFDDRFPGDGFNCCSQFPVGSTVEKRRQFTRFQTRTYNIENIALFTVKRNNEQDGRIQFALTLPPNIPS